MLDYPERAYKYAEITDYFTDFIQEQEANDPSWITDNIDDLHHHAFNTDYYIIGTFQATQWLGDNVFDIIGIIKEYEEENFGEVSTDLTDPERIVNMYVYIVGEQIVSDWKEAYLSEEVA